jgi:hypothetical protein
MINGPHPWRTLGVTGAALALSVVLVHIPAVLWAGNSAELDFPAITFLGLGAAAAATGIAIVAIGLRWLPVPAQAVTAALLCAIGVIAWVYGLLLAGGMRVLDTVGTPLDFAHGPGWWELPLVAAIGAGLAWAIGRYPSIALRLIVLLNVGLIVASAATVISAERPSAVTIGGVSTVFRFSRQTNVLVVLLDGLQSDVAERAIAQRPSLKQAFAGFVLYRDTVGVAPTTFLAVPAIHSGVVYGGHRAPGAYFTDAIAKRSFVTRFAAAGYDTSLVNPLQNVCPARIAACVSIPQVLGTEAEELRRETLRLLDLSLFRVVPFRIKPWVYQEGRWLVGGSTGESDEVRHIIDGNRMLDEIASHLTVGGKPTLKLLHNLSTHTPYVLDGECRPSSRSGLGKVVTQARCGLEAVARLLRGLDRAGVYDNTAILVLADHGINAGVFGEVPAGSQAAWEHLAGSAHPVFLFKPLGRRGDLQESNVPVYLADVSATLCAATSGCTAPLGYPAGQAPPGRPRRFNQYVWRDEFWRTHELPGLTLYDVRGPVDSPASWHRLDEPATDPR